MLGSLKKFRSPCAFKDTRVLLAATVVAMSLFSRAGAQQIPFPNYPEPNLPQMGRCVNRTPIPLPEKWAAITLMSPYLYEGVFPNGAELRVGRLVYDASVGAMRVAVYRVGTPNVIDLLITHDDTWLLGGSWDDPTCVAGWGKQFPVPRRIWQDSEAVCVGNHRTAPTMKTGPLVDWWKQPSPIQARGAEGQAADWFWFDKNGYPTRTFFWGDHPGLPAVLSEYTYSNFYSFEPVGSTNLASIVAKCEAEKNLPILDANQRIAYRRAEQEPREGHPTDVGELIPGLSPCTAEVPPPSWPTDIYMTSFSTAAKFSTPRPLSTSVYYDPAGPNLRTRLHKIEKVNGKYVRAFSDALLLDKDSFGIDFLAQSPYTQLDAAAGPHTSLPGAPHPDWGARGGARCMAILKNNPVLSPNRTTQIVAAPLPDYSGDTLFWMWYTVTDPPEPIVFLQARADITIGTGLSLADYYHWETPESIPSTIFTRPTDYEYPPNTAPVPPASCIHCHNPSVNSGHGTSRWVR
jgi:hypothetical protein